MHYCWSLFSAENLTGDSVPTCPNWNARVTLTSRFDTWGTSNFHRVLVIRLKQLTRRANQTMVVVLCTSPNGDFWSMRSPIWKISLQMWTGVHWNKPFGFWLRSENFLTRASDSPFQSSVWHATGNTDPLANHDEPDYIMYQSMNMHYSWWIMGAEARSSARIPMRTGRTAQMRFISGCVVWATSNVHCGNENRFTLPMIICSPCPGCCCVNQTAWEVLNDSLLRGMSVVTCMLFRAQ